MESLTEVDSSGDSTSNKVSSFASQDYEWETNENGEFQGLSVIVVCVCKHIKYFVKIKKKSGVTHQSTFSVLFILFILFIYELKRTLIQVI